MTDGMVDTNVVIYAMRGPRAGDKPDFAELLTASQVLIRGLNAIRVSATVRVGLLGRHAA